MPSTGARVAVPLLPGRQGATGRRGHRLRRPVHEHHDQCPAQRGRARRGARQIVDYFREQLVATTDYASGCPIAAGSLGADESDGARTVAGEAFTAWEHTIATALWHHGVAAGRPSRHASIAAIDGALILARVQRSTQPVDRVGNELSGYVKALLPRECLGKEADS